MRTPPWVLFPTLTLLFFLASGPTPVLATEVDDFTNYYSVPLLRDSRVPLNAIVNGLLEEARAETPDCSLKDFEKRLSGKLVSFRLFQGPVESFAVNSPDIERTDARMSGTIYAGTPFARSFIGQTYGVYPSLRIGNILVGTDKFGHFLDHGFLLYKKWHEKGASLDALLDESVDQEEGAYGWTMTGVKSYGDMMANFEGYRFWKSLFSALAENPYLDCRAGRLVSKRDFDFADLIHAGWSEALNCSEFANRDQAGILVDFFGAGHDFKAQVRENIGKLERRENRRYTCPIQAELCAALKSRLLPLLTDAGTQLPKLVHPDCLAAGGSR